MKSQKNYVQRQPSDEVAALKRKCPLPILLRKLGLDRHVKKSCISPLRDDRNPSWGIYQANDGQWRFKDHGNGDAGDEITFLAKYHHLDERKDFRRILDRYADICAKDSVALSRSELPVQEQREKPNRLGFTIGTDQQLDALVATRDFKIEALKFAQNRGVLVFGFWHGLQVYGVTDKSGNVIELRRLDNQLFPAVESVGLQQRKSHSIKGSRKNWPLGILETAESPQLLLCEGVPDFLAAHQIIQDEGKIEKWAPVAMLSASSLIGDDALPSFTGKHVRIIPHVDPAGLKAASRWRKQLLKVGAAKVDFVDLSKFNNADGARIKDLCDFKHLHAAYYENEQEKWRILE